MNKNIFLAALFCLLVGCSSVSKTQTVSYTGFTVAKPTSWTEKESSGIFEYHPNDNSSGESITFFTSKVPKNVTSTITQLVDVALSGIKTKVPDLTVVSKAKDAKLGTLNGLRVQFSGTFGSEKMMFTQVFARQQNDIYTWTYSCPISKCNSYEVFNQMVASFKLR